MKVDKRERGKMDRNDYELAWPTNFFFFWLQLNQIEATNAADRLLFRSLQKLC